MGRMWQAVVNCVRHCGIPLEEALRMASTRPAQVLPLLPHPPPLSPLPSPSLTLFQAFGLDLGLIETGRAANLIVFSPDTLELVEVLTA